MNDALTRTTDPVELARIRLDLARLAMAQGRLEEADAIATALANDEDPRFATHAIRIEVDSLRIRIRLARKQSQDALALGPAASRSESGRPDSLATCQASRFPGLAKEMLLIR